MKLSRFATLAVIALLAIGTIGGLGVVGTRVFAKAAYVPVRQAQVQPTAQSNPASEQSEQNEGENPSAEHDGDQDEQDPKYSSSITVDDAAMEGMSEADEAAALASLAKISVEEAKSAALAAYPGTTVVKAELENENGALVYSVELSNGSDVKVDAGNAAILHTDLGEADEG